MIVESLPRRPLTLIGSGWQSTFDQFFKELDMYTSAMHRELLSYADDLDTAVNILDKSVVTATK